MVARLRTSRPQLKRDPLGTRLRLPVLSFRCSSCGAEHSGVPLVWGPNAPERLRLVPRNEWASRVSISQDDCVIDRETYLVRGCLDLPIRGTSEPFRWLVWTVVSRQGHRFTMSPWRRLVRLRHQPYAAVLDTVLPYEPSSAGLAVEIRSAGPGYRPNVAVSDSTHPLAIEQRNGIALERAYELAGRMLHALKLAVLGVLLSGLWWPCLAQQPPAPRAANRDAAWAPESLLPERSPGRGRLPAPIVIRFHNGQRFATGLYEVTFLGTLPARPAPYLVLSGRGCTDCDANISVYFLSPLGPRASEAITDRYWSPGQETDPSTGTVIRKSRAFIGNCLQDVISGVVWYDSLLSDKGDWATGLAVVRIVADTVAAELRRPAPSPSLTLQRVRTGVCREIPGINQSSEP